MKFTIIFILITILISTEIFSQKFEISPFAGYLFAGTIQTDKGALNIKNGFNYGAFVDITVNKNLMAEFWYSRLPTELFLERSAGDEPIEGHNEGSQKLFDMTMEYFHGGGIYTETLGKFRPFAAISLGATRFNPLDDNFQEYWTFSVTIGGGGKYYLTETIGIRFDWRVLLPRIGASTSVFCTNGRCIFNVEGGTTILQAHFTGGIIILL